MRPGATKRRKAASIAEDRSAFLPGLHGRGHEDVLDLSTRELLAALPRSRAGGNGRRAGAWDRFEGAASDQEVVEAFLRRHGHLE